MEGQSNMADDGGGLGVVKVGHCNKYVARESWLAFGFVELRNSLTSAI